MSDTETRYATIEVEMLALVWAAKKCNTYLRGMQSFEVVTDHRPLVPILNQKSLQDIENPRLQRLRELLTPYNFVATWRKGQQHQIADALSRYPVDPPGPPEADEEQAGSLIARIVTESSHDGLPAAPFEDVSLSAMRAAADHDPELLALKDVILDGFPDHKADVDPLIRPYWCMRDRLSIDDRIIVCGHRIVVPKALRKSVLQSLHASHQGEVRTKRRARQTVYWPGIDQDVTNVVQSCLQCRTHLPAQQREPIIQEKTPSRVFEAVSADLFEHAGKTYLVYVDRLSGWPCISHMARDATAKSLTTALRRIFSYTGVPVVLRTDGGPQFTAGLTRRFLGKWGVQHQVSSPHYPQANGHAEAAVKSVKRLVQKTTTNGQLDDDAFTEGLIELRNSPRADGRSAAQILYGHPLRSTVPAHHRAFAQCWQKMAEECDAHAAEEKKKVAERYNMTAKPLSEHLRMGQHVLVRDAHTGLWDRTGIISGVGDFRTFLVRFPSGRLCWRNRRFLRPVRPLFPGRQPAPRESQDQEPSLHRPTQQMQLPRPQSQAPPPAGAATSTADPQGDTASAVEPRRSSRPRSRPPRLQVRWGPTSYMYV